MVVPFPGEGVELGHLGGVVGGGGGGEVEGSRQLSKWNRCRFECKICGKSSHSRAFIVSHITEEHGLTFHQYTADHPDLEVASCWLACRLCTGQVKFTKEAVAGHMRLSHGITIATYEALYMQDSDWPVEGSTVHQEESTMHQEESTMHQEGSSRRPSSHSFSSESLPGELVIAELEGEEQPRGGGEGAWNRCCFQ